MAGDWIKMRVDLYDDPAVLKIASKTGLDEDTVVGKLHRLWSWADRHTINGTTDGVAIAWVDRFVTHKGFAEAMIIAGWLEVRGDSISFPAFERHNGASAKKRCDDQTRQRLSRKNRDEGVTGLPRDIIPRPFVKRVMSRDNYTCVYCGTCSDENSESTSRRSKLSIDHIVPVSRGGKTAIEALVTCCKLCNNEKNDRTPEEWGMPLDFLQDGLTYDEASHTLVTNSRDNIVTREEKRREEVLGVVGASVEQPPPAFDRKILDPINFDPWLQAFLPMWDATPGVVKQGSQISEMERREIEKRLADPWWEKNWRRALEMFPLPWFQSQGNLVGLLSFLEDGFVQKVCQRKYHNKWSKPSSKRESKVDEIVDVISQVQEMQDRRESAASSVMRRLT